MKLAVGVAFVFENAKTRGLRPHFSRFLEPIVLLSACIEIRRHVGNFRAGKIEIASNTLRVAEAGNPDRGMDPISAFDHVSPRCLSDTPLGQDSGWMAVWGRR